MWRNQRGVGGLELASSPFRLTWVCALARRSNAGGHGVAGVCQPQTTPVGHVVDVGCVISHRQSTGSFELALQFDPS
jgi:hypothetical protein